MEEQFLRRREVEKITGLSRSTIYRLMDAGVISPIALVSAPNAVRWRLSEIIAWMESQATSQGDEARPAQRGLSVAYMTGARSMD